MCNTCLLSHKQTYAYLNFGIKKHTEKKKPSVLLFVLFLIKLFNNAFIFWETMIKTSHIFNTVYQHRWLRLTFTVLMLEFALISY